MEDSEEDDESMYMFIISCSCMDNSFPDDPPIPMPMALMLSTVILGSKDESWQSVGEGAGELFFSLFLTVEFQKFFISLSVLPGRRAAI